VIEVWTDGLCEPINPSGTACYGYVIKRNEKTINKDYGVVGKGPNMTNNVAEYIALIQALEKIKSLKLDKEKIMVRSDSNLLVNQMTRKWKVKAPLILPLFRKAFTLANGLDIAFRWIPREENEEADELCRLAYESAE